MYSVLIVDDEPTTLIGIRKTFNWSQYGFELLWEVTSSRQALDNICKYRPDLVITDIRMPVINGIDLMKITRDKNIDSEFIVISGFAEFEYAKEAINVGAFAYLLKPLQRQEANDVLSKLSVQINNKVLVKNIKIYDDLASDNINLETLFLNYNFDKVYKYYQLIFALSDCEITNAKQCIFNKDINIIDLNLGLNKCLFIINTDENVYEQLKERYNSNMNTSNISFGVSEITKNATKVSHLMRHAEIASFSSFICGQQNVYDLSPKCDILKKLINHTISTLEKDNHLDIKTFCIQLKETIVSYKLSVEDLAKLWNNIVAFVTRQYTEDHIESYDVKFLNAEQLYYNFKNIDNFIVYLTDLFTLLSGEAGLNDDANYKPESIKKILEYIDLNYFDPDISLNNISKMFYINTAYCCVLFKKCTGKTISEYITDLRMTKACEMLKDKSLSIKDVSYGCGYNDYFYFNRVFKKKIGATPANYKKTH